MVERNQGSRKRNNSPKNSNPGWPNSRIFLLQHPQLPPPMPLLLSLLICIQTCPHLGPGWLFHCDPLSFALPPFVNAISFALNTFPNCHILFTLLNSSHPMDGISSGKPSLDAWLGQEPPLGPSSEFLTSQPQWLCLTVICFSVP